MVADYYLLRNDHQTHCCSKRNESFKATTFFSFLSSSSQWFMPPSSLFHLLWKKTVWFVYFSSSNPEKVILAVGPVKKKDQVYAVTRGLVLTFILLTYQKHFWIAHNSPIYDKYQTQSAKVRILPWKQTNQDHSNNTLQRFYCFLNSGTTVPLLRIRKTWTSINP